MRQKRGMSNLVATVLLVTSAIAIAILIFVWISHSIKEETDKSSDITTAEQLCKDIEIRINEASKTLEQNTAEVKVENLRDRKITALRVRLEYGKEVEMKKIDGEIDGYESKTFKVSSTSVQIGSQTKIKVIPEIILKRPEITSAEAGWWLCSDKAVEVVLE